MGFKGIGAAVRQDVGYAFRQMARSPGASTLAVLTLALGIGATSAVFSIVNAVVLEAVPFEDPDRLVVVRELTPQGDYFSTSEPNYLDWTDRQRTFETIGAYTLGDITLTGGDRAARLDGLRVSHSLFDVLRIVPVAGRTITPAEDLPESAERVAVLSEGSWESRFGGDPDVVGSRIELDGVPHVVVGVVPTNAGFPEVEVFTPLRADRTSDRGNHMLQVVGRLKPGTTMEEARSDIERVAAELAAEYPSANAEWSATITPLRDYRVNDRLARSSTFLLIAVGLILLMACGSLATMLVAQASGRQRELGLRVALGAGRRRILAQLLAESAVVGLFGGALGVVLAWLGTPLLRQLGPADLPRLARASVDGGVLTVALLASIASVLVFGLAPAVFATRRDHFAALRESSPSVSRAHRGFLNALVVAQFALAIVVVIGAGLVTRSFARIQAIDLGFHPEGVLQFSIGLPDESFSSAQRLTFIDQLRLRTAAMPGVDAVGVSMTSPFSDFQAANFVAPSNDVPDRQDDFVPVSWRAVDGGFFESAGVRVLAGRVFAPQDAPPNDEALYDSFEPAVIIDDGLARELWGTTNVVGRAVVWGDPAGTTMRIVGVVGGIHDERVEGAPRPRIYVPYSLFPWPSPSVLVRSTGDPTSLAPGIREIVHELDPRVPVMDVATLPTLTRRAVAWPRFTMQVVSGFGFVAVLLAALGVFGVSTLAVQRRRKEIGIRVALGAEPGRIARLVLRDATGLAVVGIALGVMLAFATAGVLNAVLYDIEPRDPLTFTVLPVGLAVVAVLSALRPARAATKVDPVEAIAAE